MEKASEFSTEDFLKKLKATDINNLEISDDELLKILDKPEYKEIVQDIPEYWQLKILHVKTKKEAEEIKKENKKLRRKIKGASNRKKSITKHSLSMLKAQKVNEFDFFDDNSIFSYLRETGKFEETKEAFSNRNLLHLRNTNGYLYDALLYYVHLFRYSQKYDKYKKDNLRNGNKIVKITREHDIDKPEGNGDEERLRIQDSWTEFCKRAGISDIQEKREFLRELQKGMTIGAVALSKNSHKKDTLIAMPNFITYKFTKSDNQKSNFKNNPKNEVVEDIVLHVETAFLCSLLDVDSTGHNGWVHYPYPLQQILRIPFIDPDKKKQLTLFCEENKFKSKGLKWDIGYKIIYEQVHGDIYFQQTHNWRYKKQDCHLLKLGKQEIERYAKAISKSYHRGGKFRRKDATEFILKALKVIELACDNEDKDLIKILGIEQIGKEIHIFLKKFNQNKASKLEKTLLIDQN